MNLFKDSHSFNKFTFFTMIVIIILLIVMFVVELNHISLYNKRKEEGNARWKQVEDRIERYEDKIDVFIELSK